MCSGRVDPYLMLEAFVDGADGVFIGACLPGECHYSSGNYHAKAKVMVVRSILENAGINPDRLVIRMMSSAEGGKFVQYASEFIQFITDLGAIGQIEKLEADELMLKLTAARNAVAGKKLRWIMGKNLEFQEQGNLYGEVFTEHELKRLFDEVILDECTIQEIKLLLKEQAVTAKQLSKQLDVPTPRIVRHLADMRKVGLVEVSSENGGSAFWKAT